MSLTKKINKLISNRPQYQINDEAFQNQNLARSQAFGRNSAIQAQQENVEQEANNTVQQAKDVSSSTSGLLSTIAAINANKNQNLRGLAQDEAGIKQQNMNTLYGVNNQVIDEKDKAWNYNVNDPYQTKLATLRDKKKSRADLATTIASGALTAAGTVLGGPAGGAAGSVAGKALFGK